MELNNIIFPSIFIIIGFVLSKYLLLIIKNSKTNLLVDNQFKKPQAFHESSTYRLGGIIIFTLLVLVFLYLYFYKDIFLYEYFSFCVLFFILGLIDDLKINIAPKFRLLIMISFLTILIISNNFYISKSGFQFLDHLLEIDIFALTFISVCFLFIINGSNLIDGFNGLLGIHAIIIFFVLFIINLINENFNLANILFYLILLSLIFIKFNFPKAKIFFGDRGAYLIGTLISVSVIQTSILTPSISPLFYCVLLFYLFFEVFFSFFRKLFFARQSPLLPDSSHLHMFFYKFLLKKNKSILKSNYMVSIYINLSYFLLIIPGVIFMNDGLFCRYYFFFLLIIYIYCYKILYRKIY